MEGGNAARRNHKLAFVIDGRGSGRSFAGRYLASISRRVIAVSRVTPKPLVTRFDVSSSAFVPPFFHRLSYLFFLNPFSRTTLPDHVPRYSIEIHRSDPITRTTLRVFPSERLDSVPRVFRTRDFFSFLNTVYDVADCLTDSPVTSNAVHGSSNRFSPSERNSFSTNIENNLRIIVRSVVVLPRRDTLPRKDFHSSASRLATLKSSYGETRVRTNKIREIEPNPRRSVCRLFLPSTLRDDEASDRVAYLSSGRHLPLDRPLSLVFVSADSLSRAFSLAEQPSRSARNQRSLRDSRFARRTRSETTRPAENEQIYFSSANMFDRSLVARRLINSR